MLTLAAHILIKGRERIPGVKTKITIFKGMTERGTHEDSKVLTMSYFLGGGHIGVKFIII